MTIGEGEVQANDAMMLREVLEDLRRSVQMDSRGKQQAPVSLVKRRQDSEKKWSTVKHNQSCWKRMCVMPAENGKKGEKHGARGTRNAHAECTRLKTPKEMESDGRGTGQAVAHVSRLPCKAVRRFSPPDAHNVAEATRNSDDEIQATTEEHVGASG